MLGRDIGRLEGRCGQRMGRGGIDDAAPAALLHARNHGADAMKGRRQVDGDDLVPFLDRDSSTGDTNWMPALLMRISTAPKFASASSTMAAISAGFLISAGE